jgi:hypothetical protein
VQLQGSDKMGITEIMFNPDGSLNITEIFMNSWFFNSVDLAFLFILFGAVFLLNRYGVNFGQLVGIIFALALLFATMFGSAIAWTVVILIAVFSGLRLLQNLLIRV